jgi:hypothetical protein
MSKPIDPARPRKRAAGVARTPKLLKIPSDLASEVDRLAGPRRFSVAVEEALIQWVRDRNPGWADSDQEHDPG